jgi:hypothetical protein
VAGFTLLVGLLYCGKAYHIDEPAYLAIAGQILKDPFHPLAFDYNWFGFSTPMWQVNAFPTLFPYFLAPVLALTGGTEWLTRLAFLPFDLLAALSLYALAARLLRRPLGPTLILLAGPAYLINMGHLMPDKLVAAFALAGLACFLTALEEDRPAFFAWAGALLAAAMLCKLTAVFALLAALAAGWGRRPARWLALFGALTAAPLLAVLAGAYLGGGAGGGVAGTAWRGISGALAMSGAEFGGRLRALLAFTGGCGIVTMAWPFLERARGRRWKLGLAAAAVLAGALFLPFWDAAEVPLRARLLGAAFSLGAVFSLSVFGRSAALRRPQARFLAAWAASVILLQLLLYWSVVTRYVAFLIIPVVLAQAAALETRLGPAALRRTYAVGFGVVFILSMALARVDYRYAAAQKETAGLVAEQARGKRLWFTGHWGFQYYMEKAGASQIDALAGGWGAPRPGDVVVVPAVNSRVLPLPGPAAGRGIVLPCPEPVPLRLMGRGGAGFYSSKFGFLPYSVDSGPVDSFRILLW